MPFNFDVSIEEGGSIRGVAATEHRWGTVSWDVSGAVTGGTSFSRRGPGTHGSLGTFSGGGGVGTPYGWR